jgi:type IV pilus assembly protein PilC
MPAFNYTATNKTKQTVKGSLQATSREAAFTQLVKMGLKPISIVKGGQNLHKDISLPFGKKKVPTKDKVVFTRQLSTMVSAGVPLTKSLDTLESQTESKAFKEALAGISREVKGGLPLSDAMAGYPKIFDAIYVNMVRAGEAAGILDKILKRLALQQEKDAAIRRKLKSAMTYPTIILVITFVAFYFLMTNIVPKITGILESLGSAELPVYTKAMIAISNGMQKYGVFMILGMVGFVIFIRRWRKSPSGRKRFDSLLLKIPVIKMVITKVAIARFARIFSSLSASGVPVLETLRVTGEAIGNSVIEAELAKAALSVKNGKPLSQPLSESKIFPPIVAQMLAVGEETGEVDVILVKVAEFYEDEVDAVISSLSSIIEPLMIVVLGSIVGLIAASIFGPISQISQAI